MSLTPGTRLGPYEIAARVGVGGMGEVYRATDTNLKRQVALKVLPAAVASDLERLARFQREAEVLASLNHPNIAAIYRLERADGVSAIVMELVEGPTLADRIAERAIPLDEVLTIARQIADALDAAHEQGIIHRDLKPANIKVRPDGTVKVLDFGLAKAHHGAGGAGGLGATSAADQLNSPTITSPGAMTMRGMILGTAAYMAPEQAKGKAVDKRADIWAFGCVLYEMLTGRVLFGGDSVAESIGLVMTRDPDWQTLPPQTPVAVIRLLARCLAKDPRHRLRDIGDASIELEQAFDVSPGPPAPATVERRGLPMWTLPLTIVLTAAAAAAAVAWFRPATTAPPRTVVRFDINARDLRVEPHRHPILSPNGRRVAWAAGGSLWLRELDRAEARVLVPSVDPLHLAWSPDSQEIMFYSANRLWRVRTPGGEPVVIAEATFRRGANSPGAAWLEDGRIVFAPSASGTGLLVVEARGGALRSFLEAQPGISDFHSPSPLPGSRGVLVVADRDPDGIDTIAVVADGTLHTVIRDKGERFESPVYSTAGFVLFERQVTGRGIWAIPYSLEQRAPTGSPFLVAANASWPSVSADGTLVHTGADSGSVLEFTIADRTGRVMQTVGQPAIALSQPRVSPDGQRIVATLRDESGARDLYAFDIATGSRTRLTFGNNPLSPRWAPGKRVIFTSGEPGTNAPAFVGVISTEGGGKPQELVRGGFDADISSDGRWLVYYRVTRERGADILGLPLDPTSLVPIQGQSERPIVAGPANERKPVIHPSGAFLAYVGEDTGRAELYVTRFPDGQGKWQVTSGGVDYATWTPTGNGLLYSQGGRVMEVPISLGSAVAIGTPRVVLEAASTRALLDQTFDMTKDSKAVVFIRRPLAAGEMLGAITVVQNWIEEFRSAAGR